MTTQTLNHVTAFFFRADETKRGVAALIGIEGIVFDPGNIVELEFGSFLVISNDGDDEFGYPLVKLGQIGESFTLHDFYESHHYCGAYGLAAG